MDTRSVPSPQTADSDRRQVESDSLHLRHDPVLSDLVEYSAVSA